tara:strand:- start:657 stop:1532 length:876 start_codon:yes stop_codon:yes gene_type:complete
MRNLKIFCFGFGQVAKNFIKKLESKNISYKLSATSRHESEIRKFEKKNYQSFKFNEQDYDENLLKDLEESEYILISISPKNGKDIVIKNFGDKLNNPKFKWITYLSATSVYGNHDGKWVDEKSETKPTSISGVERLEAEKDWLRLYKQHDCPVQIFRLSGIYSDQYNILRRLKSGEAKIVNKKDHFFSRIHVDDIANVLYQSLDILKKGEVYNISDDRPASNEEVIMHGIKLLGIEKPGILEINDIQSEMLKNFYKDSKKVSNKKMKNFFKLSLKFPTFVEGLNYINNNSI